MNAHREVNAKRAKSHTTDMDARFADEIAASVRATIIYSGDMANKKIHRSDEDMWVDTERILSIKNPVQTMHRVTMCDTVEALFKSAFSKVVLLNFASFTEPGGMFYDGSYAQEEALCHMSTLYNVLREFRSSYYTINAKNKNKGIYTNRALYTPNVRFFDGEGHSKFADVITCAAPNRSPALRYGSFTDEENNAAMESRIEFLKIVATDANPCISEIILGAWGCGVFKQDPEIVANLFDKYFDETTFERVTYAIPAGKNFDVFNRVILN